MSTEKTGACWVVLYGQIIEITLMSFAHRTDSTSGYEGVEILKILDGIVELYLPDM